MMLMRMNMRRRVLLAAIIVSCLVALSAVAAAAASGESEPIGCGGFIKSNTEINFETIKVKLLSKNGLAVKYITEASRLNGYYMIPVYEHGEYVLQVNPPPGWSFEPSTIAINVDGKTDACSRNEDINFQFKGFGVSGKIVTQGDPKLSGPAGITLNLLSNNNNNNNNNVQHTTVSAADGTYYFSDVMPGDYHIEASHASIAFATRRVSVALSKENWSPKDDIVVSGYRVQGSVRTRDSSPVAGATVQLSSSQLQVLATATSDSAGRFVFDNTPHGTYVLRARLDLGHLSFAMLPDSLTVDVTKHANVILSSAAAAEAFVLSSVSISSVALTAAEGRSTSSGGGGGQVLVNGVESPATTIASDGRFTIGPLATGSKYTIGVRVPHVHFTDKLVHVDLTSARCLTSESGEHQRLLSLAQFVATAFDVCGHVRLVDVAESAAVVPNAQSLVSIEALQSDDLSTRVAIQTLSPASGESALFTYCFKLPAGKTYTLRPVIGEPLASLVSLVPASQQVSVLDAPILLDSSASTRVKTFERASTRLAVLIRLLDGARAMPATGEMRVRLESTTRAAKQQAAWHKNVVAKCRLVTPPQAATPTVTEAPAPSTSSNTTTPTSAATSTTQATTTTTATSRDTATRAECSFSIDNLFYGAYKLSTDYDDLYCFSNVDEQIVQLSPQRSSQTLTVDQLGFRLNYAVSHANAVLHISSSSSDSNSDPITIDTRSTSGSSEDRRRGFVCLPRLDDYVVRVESSSHRFYTRGDNSAALGDDDDSQAITIPASVFVTKQAAAAAASNTLVLDALKCKATLDVLFSFEGDEQAAASLTAEAAALLAHIDYLGTPTLGAEQASKFELVASERTRNSLLLRSESWLWADRLVQVRMTSGALLFEQGDTEPKEMRVQSSDSTNNNNNNNRLTFRAKLGIFIVGHVKLPGGSGDHIDNIQLTLKSSSSGNESSSSRGAILAESLVDTRSAFRLGPLKAPFTAYSVELAKAGYVFVVASSPIKQPASSSTDNNKNTYEMRFEASKLGQLDVSVLEAATSTSLPTALLSLSSADRTFRQTARTDADGRATFGHLKPGLYYLIVMMQEYEFRPNSQPVEVGDGQRARLVVEATRVAFSATGRVTSVNGRPASAETGGDDEARSPDELVVEALGVRSETNPRCETSKEVARVTAGLYRVRNLVPDCDYVIAIQQQQQTAATDAAQRQIPTRHEVRVHDADLTGLDFVMWSGADTVDVSVAVSYKAASFDDNQLSLSQAPPPQFVRIKLFETNRPESVLQIQYVPCNSIAYFNELPMATPGDNANALQYSVQVELLMPLYSHQSSSSSSSSSSHHQSQHQQQQQQQLLQQQSVLERVEVTFEANANGGGHKHVSVRLGGDSQQRQLLLDAGGSGGDREREYQTVYFALAPLLIVMLGMALNMHQVQQSLSVVRTSLRNGAAGSLVSSLFGGSVVAGSSRKDASATTATTSAKQRNKQLQQQQQQQQSKANASRASAAANAARLEAAAASGSTTTETSSDSDMSPAPLLKANADAATTNNNNLNDYSASTEDDSDFPAAALVKRKVKKIH